MRWNEYMRGSHTSRLLHNVSYIPIFLLSCLSLARSLFLSISLSAGIHMTLYATGCIYEYDAHHTIGGKGFTEECKPNYTGLSLVLSLSLSLFSLYFLYVSLYFSL